MRNTIVWNQTFASLFRVIVKVVISHGWLCRVGKCWEMRELDMDRATFTGVSRKLTINNNIICVIVGGGAYSLLRPIIYISCIIFTRKPFHCCTVFFSKDLMLSVCLCSVRQKAWFVCLFWNEYPAVVSQNAKLDVFICEVTLKTKYCLSAKWQKYTKQPYAKFIYSIISTLNYKLSYWERLQIFGLYGAKYTSSSLKGIISIYIQLWICIVLLYLSTFRS